MRGGNRVTKQVQRRAYLCCNLNLSIFRNQLRWNRDPLDYLDSRVDNSVILHIGHTDELVDLRNAKPVKGVRPAGRRSANKLRWRFLLVTSSTL